MARPHILGHEIFTRIAQKYHQNAGLVPLSWAVQRGVTVIPKSSSEGRIKENTKLFMLEDDDMAKLMLLTKTSDLSGPPTSTIKCGLKWTVFKR
jgi:diketogulonate reductase-like aldo/keto reductase